MAVEEVTRNQISSEIGKLIGEGDLSGAYAKFEELPIVEQIAVSVAPGIGDALAAYEVKEFGSRGVQNIREGNVLGGLGNLLMSGLAGASLIPILRAGRGLTRVARMGDDIRGGPSSSKSLNNDSGLIDLKKQGFDIDNPLYHGSKDVFDEFDLSKTGQRDKGFYGKGIYLTPLKREAEQYGPNVKEYFVKGKMLDLEGGSELQRVFDEKSFKQSQMENAFDAYKGWASKLDKIDALPPAQKLAYKDFLKAENYFKNNVNLTKTGQDEFGNEIFTASIKLPDSDVVVKSDNVYGRDAEELFEIYLGRVKNSSDFPNLRNMQTRLSMVVRDLDDAEYNQGIEDVSEFLASKVKKAGFSGIRAGSETVVFDPKNIISSDVLQTSYRSSDEIQEKLSQLQKSKDEVTRERHKAGVDLELAKTEKEADMARKNYYRKIMKEDDLQRQIDELIDG